MRSTALIALLRVSLVSAQSWKFSTDQRGFFVQEHSSVNSNPPDFANTFLGILNKQYETDMIFDPQSVTPVWERFAYYLDHLNKVSGQDTSYKLLYVSRHAEGYHNVAEKLYGEKCWTCYWSQQTGNNQTDWADASLTEKGIRDMVNANAFWRTSPEVDKVPFPEIFYTSPLMRCLQTVNITFADSPLLYNRSYIVVDENIRAALDGCTCAWRRTKNESQSLFPDFTYAPDMPIEDNFWGPGQIESKSSRTKRVHAFLERVWSGAQEFVSVTTHGQIVSDILEAVGHPNPKFRIPDGQTIPIFVRGDKLPSNATVPETPVEPPTQIEKCAVCSPSL